MKKVFFALCVMLAVGTTGCGTPSGSDVDAILALTANTQNGSSLWTAKCATCHGATGAGTPSGPTLVNADVKADPDAHLLNTILNGDGSMPAFSSQMTKQEIADVFGYLRKELQK